MMKLLLDVRTAEEFSAGHKDGAVHFDLQRLAAGEVPDVPRDTPIEVYCHSGARASLAVHILTMQGFSDVVNVGGFESD